MEIDKNNLKLKLKSNFLIFLLTLCHRLVSSGKFRNVRISNKFQILRQVLKFRRAI